MDGLTNLTCALPSHVGEEASGKDEKEQKQRGKLLAALGDAELSRLLDRVCGVAAGIGEADDLGARRLRLQQEGGEI